MSAAGRVAEPLGHREGRQRDAETGTGRLVHLAEDHAGLLDDGTIGLADLGLLHFQPQVVPLAGPLADAGEDREAAVRAGDTGDEFGQNDGLAQSGSAEQPGLAAADERRQQVDDLDAGLEDFRLGAEILHRGRCAVDGPTLFGDHSPRPSTGSPSRLNTRPSVPFPTGTVTEDTGVERLPFRGPCRRSNPRPRTARGHRPGAAALPQSP